jgi:hypothetical protein
LIQTYTYIPKKKQASLYCTLILVLKLVEFYEDTKWPTMEKIRPNIYKLGELEQKKQNGAQNLRRLGKTKRLHTEGT